jgi:hypothetical protein
MTEFNLCPVSVTALQHQAKCLFAYAAIAPVAVEGDIIQAATILRAAAAFITATNERERQIKREL